MDSGREVREKIKGVSDELEESMMFSLVLGFFGLGSGWAVGLFVEEIEREKLVFRGKNRNLVWVR